MTTPRRLFRIAPALVLLALALPSPAFGQANRTFVSGVGDDANPCSRTAPCKTFAGAISKTADGGGVDFTGPGGFAGGKGERVGYCERGGDARRNPIKLTDGGGR